MRLIDAEALKPKIDKFIGYLDEDMIERIKVVIDNAPTVEPFEPDYVGAERLKARQRGYEEGYHTGMEIGKTLNPKIKQSEWIPVKYRPMTSEERKAFADYCGIEYCDTFGTETFDCPMPEDGQHILLSKSWGVVEDVAYNDLDGYGFICYELETNGDWDGVNAWMPMPAPYKKGGAE